VPVAWLPDGSRLSQAAARIEPSGSGEVENGLMVASPNRAPNRYYSHGPPHPRERNWPAATAMAPSLFGSLTSNEQLHVLSNHDVTFLALDWSPDGSRLLSTSWDRTARVWDGETGEELLLLEHGGWVKAGSLVPWMAAI